jgi:hypothetical protein
MKNRPQSCCGLEPPQQSTFIAHVLIGQVFTALPVLVGVFSAAYVGDVTPNAGRLHILHSVTPFFAMYEYSYRNEDEQA